MKVIIFTNEQGGVSVCVPTDEANINLVLTKDCPAGAIIVENSTLPTSYDNNIFFSAWELHGEEIIINIDKAKETTTSMVNSYAISESQKRLINNMSGIDNNPSDEVFKNILATARSNISAANSTDDLVAILKSLNIIN